MLAISDAVGRASLCSVGTSEWWEAVGAARAANTEHMGEEEDEVLPHFRARADLVLRDELGLAFEVAKTGRLDLSDKEPDAYVAEHS